MGDMNYMALECSKQSQWMMRLDILSGLHCSMIIFYFIGDESHSQECKTLKVNMLVYMIH